MNILDTSLASAVRFFLNNLTAFYNERTKSSMLLNCCQRSLTSGRGFIEMNVFISLPLY